MTRKDRGPGRRFPGPRENDSPGAATVAVIVGHAGEIHTDALVQRFGQPSSYSLSAAELAAEVRRRRREGWQSWEIRARFDFWRAA
jgi:hypothetical protein